MKSRWTTYLLLTAVAVVWGVVVWKIFFTTAKPAPPPPKAAAAPDRAVRDTLLLDYPDPFLKGQTAAHPTAAIVRALPPPAAKVRRERVALTHRGTVVSGRTRFYIVTIGNEQVELAPGGEAAGFVCASADGDSLYLRKEGVIYGVKLCE